jgi:hypothetical protein
VDITLPVEVLLTQWYCVSNPGGLISLASDRLVSWRVTAIHARYIAPAKTRRIEGQWGGFEIVVHLPLRAYLVDVDGGLLLPSLDKVVARQDMRGRWWLRESDAEYLASIAPHERPVTPCADLVAECCVYQDLSRGWPAGSLRDCER